MSTRVNSITHVKSERKPKIIELHVSTNTYPDRQNDTIKTQITNLDIT